MKRKKPGHPAGLPKKSHAAEIDLPLSEFYLLSKHVSTEELEYDLWPYPSYHYQNGRKIYYWAHARISWSMRFRAPLDIKLAYLSTTILMLFWLLVFVRELIQSRRGDIPVSHGQSSPDHEVIVYRSTEIIFLPATLYAI